MENISYEQALQELTEIVAKLECGQATLDESLKLFERGKELIAICYANLNQAKGKLTEIKESLDRLEEV